MVAVVKAVKEEAELLQWMEDEL